jgi:hypothetical protein
MTFTRKLLATTAAIAILGCFTAQSSFADDHDRQRSAGDDHNSRVEAGFEIAEQQGIILNRDSPAVGLGSYIVNTAGCNDCHTQPNFAPGGDPFARQPKQYNVASYLAGGRSFGPICSRNITPAPGTHKAAGLSRADFLYLIKTGCDPQGTNFRDPGTCELLQVMPWPLLRDMTRQDLSAVYSYLSALPHADPGADAQCVPEPQGIANGQ